MKVRLVTLPAATDFVESLATGPPVTIQFVWLPLHSEDMRFAKDGQGITQYCIPFEAMRLI